MPNFTTTANFGLRLYQPGVRGWGGDMNANLQNIDTQLQNGKDAGWVSSGVFASARLPRANVAAIGAVLVAAGANLTLDTSTGALSLTAANVTAALGAAPVLADQLGQVNGVATLDGSGKLLLEQLPTTATGHRQIAELEATGQLSQAGSNDTDYDIIPFAVTIAAITIACDNSPLSGNIVIDLLMQDAEGNVPTSLFTSVPKPSLPCNGGLTYMVITGAGLPDITALPAGSALRLRILSAPVGADNLRVELHD